MAIFVDWKLLGSPNPLLCEELCYCDFHLHSQPHSVQPTFRLNPLEAPAFKFIELFPLSPPYVFSRPGFVNVLMDGS